MAHTLEIGKPAVTNNSAMTQGLANWALFDRATTINQHRTRELRASKSRSAYLLVPTAIMSERDTSRSFTDGTLQMDERTHS